MKVVKPKAVILFAKIGSVYYPVACAKDVTMTTTADLYELAPRKSTAWKEYEYGRLSGEITGSGLTVIDAGLSAYSIFDLIGTQFNHVKWLAKFSMQDPDGKYKVFEARVLVKEVSLSGSSTAISSYTYSLQISGEVTISSTYVVNTNPKIKTYEFEATTSTASVFIPTTGTAATILVVYVNGVSLKVNIYPDAYGAGEVQWREDTGVLSFGTNLQNGDYLKVIYIDL